MLMDEWILAKALGHLEVFAGATYRDQRKEKLRAYVKRRESETPNNTGVFTKMFIRAYSEKP